MKCIIFKAQFKEIQNSICYLIHTCSYSHSVDLSFFKKKHLSPNHEPRQGTKFNPWRFWMTMTFHIDFWPWKWEIFSLEKSKDLEWVKLWSIEQYVDKPDIRPILSTILSLRHVKDIKNMALKNLRNDMVYDNGVWGHQKIVQFSWNLSKLHPLALKNLKLRSLMREHE